MASITPHCENHHSTTSISNIFIDEYMPAANGEFVKIYLYLLRLMSSPDAGCSISSIADKFEHTEKDVRRALGYLERIHLLRPEYDSDGNLSGICLLTPVSGEAEALQQADITMASGQAPDPAAPQRQTDAATASGQTPDPASLQRQTDASGAGYPSDCRTTACADVIPLIPASAGTQALPCTTDTPADEHPAKREYSADDIRQFRQNESIAELFFIAERYLGRTLNTTDINTLLYLYDSLRFSTDLIEYLVESCVSNGHTSIRYIEKTALGWADDGIMTVDEAKQRTAFYNQTCFMVLKAFGISGRNPVPSETALVRKWSVEYGFSDELIAEACQRTMQSVHQPSFQYADSILSGWHKNHVRTGADIAQLDAAFRSRKKNNPATAAPAGANAQKNRFNNFRQRTYDYDQLEKMLLTTNAR